MSHDATTQYGHLNCSLIMSDHGRAKSDKLPRCYRERTHGCWCSSWKLTKLGFRVWRNGKWSKPKPGEIRRATLHP